MSSNLSAAVTAGCLLGGVWTVVLATRNRRPNNWLLIELILVEVLVLAQFVVAVVAVIQGSRTHSTATYLSYAFTVVLLLPVGVFWAQAERSRSSTLVIAVACLAGAVMTARMQQMWVLSHA